jgi:hypothetical protein
MSGWLPRRSSGAVPCGGVDDDSPLGQAREWLIEQVDEHDKATCPLCDKLANLYHRMLYGDPLAGLIKAHKKYEQDWFHWARVVGAQGGDGAKLEHWGLMQRASRERDPKEPGVGYWRLTDRGDAFVRNTITVPRCARIVGIRNRFVRWCDDKHPGETNIRSALGKNFDYDELMGF